MKRLAILGASGHGKVVAEIAELLGWSEIVFFDDAWPTITQNGPWPISGNSQDLENAASKFEGIIVAIGNNATRLTLSKEIRTKEFPLTTLIHPKAIVSHYASIDDGSVVMAGAIINPFAKIGLAAIINTSATIDHDCRLGDGVHVSPGAHLAGAVSVGHRTWIGIGAVIKQCLHIGVDTIVGAGSAVVNDISDHQTIVGIPGKEISQHDK
jgi:sugar O-acyltransferase (sialic acid O-acetyltransferase NeuD family)